MTLTIASGDGLAGGDTGIAWEAHVAGFVFGAAVTLPFRDTLLRRTLAASPRGAAAYS